MFGDRRSLGSRRYFYCPGSPAALPCRPRNPTTRSASPPIRCWIASIPTSTLAARSHSRRQRLGHAHLPRSRDRRIQGQSRDSLALDRRAKRWSSICARAYDSTTAAEFDADDVVYTLRFRHLGPKRGPSSRDYVRWIDRVEKVGRYKVRIVARQPFPAAIAYLASPTTVIHPHEYYATWAQGDERTPDRHWALSGRRARARQVHSARAKSRLLRGGPKAQPKIDTVEIRYHSRCADARRGSGRRAASTDHVCCARSGRATARRSRASEVSVRRKHALAFPADEHDCPRRPRRRLRDLRVRQAILHAVDRAGHREIPRRRRCARAARRVPSDSIRLRRHARVRATTTILRKRGNCSPKPVIRTASTSTSMPFATATRSRRSSDICAPSASERGCASWRIDRGVAAGAPARRRLSQQAWSGLAHSIVSEFGLAVPRILGRRHQPRSRDSRSSSCTAIPRMDVDIRKASYAKALGLIAGARLCPAALLAANSTTSSARDLAFKPYPDEIPRFYEMYWK